MLQVGADIQRAHLHQKFADGVVDAVLLNAPIQRRRSIRGGFIEFRSLFDQHPDDALVPAPRPLV